jgi:hypothetical protein
MSVRIDVDAYASYRANERPRKFCLDFEVYEIVEVEDRWYDPSAEYFKVRTVDKKRYLLRCDTRSGEWTLLSAFDGAEMLARTNITIITVEPQAIRSAEQRVTGCVRCREARAAIPFSRILADVLGKHGPYEFILTKPGQCPNCRGELLEKTMCLVE